MGTRFTVDPLPSHPRLEQQQKLAKRLPRDIRAGEADAIARVHAFLRRKTAPESMQLHDAQLVAARGYGFDSWAAMKRKIESLSKSAAERLDIAVREGTKAAARELLSHHTDIRAAINEPRFNFDSPAIHQPKRNRPLVDVLLQFCPDINARSTGWAGGFGILKHDLAPACEVGAALGRGRYYRVSSRARAKRLAVFGRSGHVLRSQAFCALAARPRALDLCLAIVCGAGTVPARVGRRLRARRRAGRPRRGGRANSGTNAARTAHDRPR